MDNRLVDATWTYHNGTKHSDQSVRTSAHSLDWPNRPLTFKVYSTLEPIQLPGDFAPPPVRARSITSTCISSAGTSRIWRPGSITSGCTTSPCDSCGLAITEAPS